MEDSSILRLSSILVIAGITSILLLSYLDRIPESRVGSISDKDEGSYVKMKGTVSAVRESNKTVSFTMKQECYITVFTFSQDIPVDVNDSVIVQGTISRYKGKYEILADKIEKVGNTDGHIQEEKR